MKYEWRKREKNLYIPKQEPELVSIPEQNFFLIKGKGNPNEQKIIIWKKRHYNIEKYIFQILGKLNLQN
ncbi:hypothetical protein OCO53_04205 [Peribacillus frigoritolerans]|uniref:hypothetical protein n=1 Tax=Peribacillus frigoritolerans TaxID=450367 RepID=UPI0021CF91AB|nr:hypothetical protein [Peribacillus frigoritolerans]MCU6599666.1 hypothetical protein [Peribacillus frigoritolerans]